MDRRKFLMSATAMTAHAAFARTTEPGVRDTEILLGQSAVLSGPLSPGVIAGQRGGKLAFEELNAQGGVAGRALRLLALDDELNPTKAAANYQALVEQHQVFACFSGVGAATTLAGLPILRASGVPLVGATAVVDSVREKSQGVAYYTRASQLSEIEGLVRHLETLGIRRIGIAHLATPGGQEVAQQLTAALLKRNLQLQGVAAVAADGSNVAEPGKMLAQQRPQALVLFLSGAPAAALMKAVWANGSAPSFYGLSILSGEVTARLLGAQSQGLAISQVTPYPWDGANPDTLQYRRAAEKAGVPVGYHSFEGYLAARVLIEALKRVGRDLTRAKLHASLRTLSQRVAGIDIDFSSGHHTGSQFTELVHVRKDGSFLR